MRHHRIAGWSLLDSPLHRRDARAKLLATLLFLLALALAPQSSALAAVPFALVLLAALFFARLPLLPLLLRSASVLPFSIVFALIEWASGHGPHGGALLAKSYVSALAVLLLAASTPMPSLLHAMESLGVPRAFVLIAQSLFRYLFVIAEVAQRMRLASLCRGGTSPLRPSAGFRASAGSLAVLFARSQQRAHGIHMAMLSRGFHGSLPLAVRPRFRPSDAGFLAAACALGAALYLSVTLR